MIKNEYDDRRNVQNRRTDQHRLSISAKEAPSDQNGHRHRTDHAGRAHLLGADRPQKQAPFNPDTAMASADPPLRPTSTAAAPNPAPHPKTPSVPGTRSP